MRRSRSSPPARHAVRRHLHGAGARAPAGLVADRGRLAGRHRPALDREATPPRRSPPTSEASAARRWSGRPRPRQDGVWLGVTAVNPVNGRELPVFVADYVLTGYGTGAIMGVAGEDVRDFEFAEKFGLPVVRTVQPPEGFDGARTGAGPMINSANDEISLNGLDKPAAIATMFEGWSSTATARRPPPTSCATGCSAGSATGASCSRSSTTRTTCRSPSRVDAAGAAARGRRLLAQDVRRRRRRLRPGAAAVAGHRVDDGRAGPWATAPEVPPRDQHDAQLGRVVLVLPALPGPGRRRADGRPGAGEVLAGPALTRRRRRRRPVRRRVEHAVLHLLYARFWHKVLHDLGHVSSEEPFRRLVNQGYISPTPTPTSAASTCPPPRWWRRTAVLLRGQTGQPRVREDRQEPEEHGHAGRDDRRLRGRHVPRLRDVDRAAGPVAALGDQGRRRVAALLQRIWRVVVDEQTGAVRASTSTLSRTPCVRCTGRSPGSATG